MVTRSAVSIFAKLDDKASKGFQNLKDKAHDAGGTFKDTSALMFSAGTVIGGTMAFLIRSAEDQRNAFNRLKTTLKNTGIEYGSVSGNIEDTIDALSKSSGQSKAAIVDSLSTLVQETGNLDSALEVLPITLDVAAAHGMTLAAATKGVADATEDGTGALAEIIPRFDEFGERTDRVSFLLDQYKGKAEENRDATAAMGASIANLAAELGIAEIIDTVAKSIEGVVGVISKLDPTLLKIIGVALAGIFVGLAVGGMVAAAIAMLNPFTLTIMGIAAAVGVLGGAVLLLMNNWGTIWETIKGVAEAVWGAISGFFDSHWAWMFTIPKLIWELVENWDSVWNTIKGTAEAVWNFIYGLYESNFGWLLPGGPLVKALMAISENWDEIWGTIKSVAETVWGAISELFTTAWDWLTRLPETIGNLKEKWDEIWDGIKDKVAEIWSGIQELYESKFGWLLPGGALFKALTGLKNNWDEIWGGIKDTVSDTWDAIVGTAKGGVNVIIDALNAMIRGLNKISFEIPWYIPGPLGGKTFGINIDEIPRLAVGGIVTRPTLAVVGERGPEAVVPLNQMEDVFDVSTQVSIWMDGREIGSAVGEQLVRRSR